jgi:ABC-2 type transport system ATP-binding protein
MDAAIKVEGLIKQFGDVKALDGVDLETPMNKVFALLGPNGAGKTTLVRVLTTLLTPDEGKASVLGMDVVRDRIQLRKEIGLAGQYAAVDEYLTGRENLMMIGQLYHLNRNEAKRRADDLLERFSLTDAGGRPAKTYSGGMRHRLDLAASLVGQPQILFLDEPTTGLDPRTRLDLWEMIRELVRGGTTLLLTTQYLEEADELADRIAVMNKGRIIAEGTADELKAEVGNDILELRVEDANDIDKAVNALEDIAADQPQIDRDGGTMMLPVPDGAQSVIEAVRRLDDADVKLADFSLRRPSLDDVFLSLTGEDTRGTSDDETDDEAMRTETR